MLEMCTYIDKVKSAFSTDNTNTFAILTYTDKFEVLSYKDFIEKSNFDNLLDCRVFNKDKELRIFRDYIGNEFVKIVELEDSMFKDMFDDEQYLDIDMVRTTKKSGKLRATGGGCYKFPLDVTEKTKVIIRNYVSYDDNGQAYIKAWRLVGFTNGDSEVK